MQNLKDLIKAGVHFGHRTSRWSPKMAPFIWGAKNKIHLIDVSKTARLLDRACDYLKEVCADGRQILFVGTKRAASDIIEQTGKKLDMPFVTNRWIGGTLSNNGQIKKAITKLMHLQDVVKKSASYYTKKELSTLQKEIARLEKNIGGIVNFSFPPAAIIVVDAKREGAAIKEAISMNIPVIAMVDTNTDPRGINFVIPANDDAPKSINVILTTLASSIEEGRKKFEEKKAKELAEKKAETKKSAPKKEATAEKAAKVEAEIKAEEKASVKKAVPKAKASAKAKTVEKKEPVKAKAKTAEKAEVKKEAKAVEKRPAAKKATTTKKTTKKVVKKKTDSEE